MDPNIKAVLDYVTPGVAVLGAGLGVLNTWRSWSQDRVRLRVGVSCGEGLIGNDRALLVNAVNLSTFDLTVTHIGFHLLGRQRHCQIFRPLLTSGENLPICLKPRTALTAIHHLGAGDQVPWDQVECAYVLTACGLEFCGGRAFFKKDHLSLAGSQWQ
ncbi:MAG: hypothetical protein RL268_78 [Pseudomonadota bacterium]|jgi:hypothetical protein